jgi:hypothetical protein
LSEFAYATVITTLSVSSVADTSPHYRYVSADINSLALGEQTTEATPQRYSGGLYIEFNTSGIRQGPYWASMQLIRYPTLYCYNHFTVRYAAGRQKNIHLLRLRRWPINLDTSHGAVIAESCCFSRFRYTADTYSAFRLISGWTMPIVSVDTARWYLNGMAAPHRRADISLNDMSFTSMTVHMETGYAADKNVTG